MSVVSPQTIGMARVYAWSLKRELWQHRAIFTAPALIGLFFVGASLLAALTGAEMVARLQDASTAQRSQFLSMPFVISTEVIRLIVVVIAAGYSMVSFHSERRDRSILFWRSLPVSDQMTVAAKASIPLVVAPAVALATILCTHAAIFLIEFVALAAFGAPLSLSQLLPSLWAESQLGGILPGTAAIILFQTLWQAPIYAYLMLISSWASRVPVLWVILTPIALSIGEWWVFGTSWIAGTIKSRLSEGFLGVASGRPMLDVIAYLTSPALWIGLLVAAGFFSAVWWMRRRAEPL